MKKVNVLQMAMLGICAFAGALWFQSPFFGAVSMLGMLTAAWLKSQGGSSIFHCLAAAAVLTGGECLLYFVINHGDVYAASALHPLWWGMVALAAVPLRRAA